MIVSLMIRLYLLMSMLKVNLLLLYASNLMIKVITIRSLCYMYHGNLDWPMQMVRVMPFKYESTYL